MTEEKKVKRYKISFGKRDYIYLDKREKAAWNLLLATMYILYKKEIERYSMTRLLKTAYKLRDKETEYYMTETRLRRLVPYLVVQRPRLLHIRQRGNFRLLRPSKYYIEEHIGKKTKKVTPS
ncbi:hypothetical protein GOV04_05030 [Candidatus Woesearchaeota archaeon]|nr:hypothetical protein [Candidatus Woesearchaeota archaeon]